MLDQPQARRKGPTASAASRLQLRKCLGGPSPHSRVVRQRCGRSGAMLGQIIGDLTATIRRLDDQHYSERHSGFDRRRAL